MEIVEEIVAAGLQRPQIDDALAVRGNHLLDAQAHALEFDGCGVEIADGASIIVRARNPRRFFRAFTRLVLENDFTIEHLEPLDDSAHAILGYLLGARR